MSLNKIVSVYGSANHGQFGTGVKDGVCISLKKNSFLTERKGKFKVGRSHGFWWDEKNVFGWGFNEYGQLGMGDCRNVYYPKLLDRVENVSTLGCGYFQTIFCKHDSTLWFVGEKMGSDDIVLQPVEIEWDKSSKIVDIHFGSSHTLFLHENGKVSYYGDKEYSGSNHDASHVLIPLESIGNIKQISCGFGHNVALNHDGEVFTWGNNLHGQCGVGVKSPKVDSPKSLNYFRENQIKIVQISAGSTHSLALDCKGRIYSWGSHKDGKLGIKDLTEDITIPTIIPYLERYYKVNKIYTGCDHNFARTDEGKTLGWGFGQHGTIGINHSKNYEIPTRIDYPGEIEDIQCGLDTTFTSFTKVN